MSLDPFLSDKLRDWNNSPKRSIYKMISYHPLRKLNMLKYSVGNCGMKYDEKNVLTHRREIFELKRRLLLVDNVKVELRNGAGICNADATTHQYKMEIGRKANYSATTAAPVDSSLSHVHVRCNCNSHGSTSIIISIAIDPFREIQFWHFHIHETSTACDRHVTPQMQHARINTLALLIIIYF